MSKGASKNKTHVWRYREEDGTYVCAACGRESPHPTQTRNCHRLHHSPFYTRDAPKP